MSDGAVSYERIHEGGSGRLTLAFYYSKFLPVSRSPAPVTACWGGLTTESVLTFTLSATVASLTREVRDLFRSCSEARAELMRSPTLCSGVDFLYIKTQNTPAIIPAVTKSILGTDREVAAGDKHSHHHEETY